MSISDADSGRYTTQILIAITFSSWQHLVGSPIGRTPWARNLIGLSPLPREQAKIDAYGKVK